MSNDQLEPSGPIFTYSFTAHTLSTAGPSDVFTVTASTASRVSVREIRIAQFSEFGDAAAELLSLQFLVGSTLIGGGTAISAVNVLRHTGAPTAGSSVTGPSTTLASTASAVLGLVDSPEIPTTAAPHQLAQELELFRPQVDCENVIPVVSPPGREACSANK